MSPLLAAALAVGAVWVITLLAIGRYRRFPRRRRPLTAAAARDYLLSALVLAGLVLAFLIATDEPAGQQPKVTPATAGPPVIYQPEEP